MGGNLEERRYPSPLDPRSAEHCDRRQIERKGVGVADSVSREWTDEKHSLYLDSMEASFVKQLHNHEYRSKDLIGWPLEDNRLHLNSSLQSNANGSAHSSEFKVLQSGCWKKINFGRAERKLDLVDNPGVLLDNQWIRHFTSARRCQDLPDVLENDALTIDPMHPGGPKTGSCGIVKSEKTTSCGAATASKELHASYSNNLYDSNREVSDQNFVDEVLEKKQIRNPYKRKKMKAACNGAIITDQEISCNSG